MTIFVHLADGHAEKIENQSRTASDETELQNLIHGAGDPYSSGWVQVQAPNPKFVAIRHIVRVEIREQGGTD